MIYTSIDSCARPKSIPLFLLEEVSAPAKTVCIHVLMLIVRDGHVSATVKTLIVAIDLIDSSLLLYSLPISISLRYKHMLRTAIDHK